MTSPETIQDADHKDRAVNVLAILTAVVTVGTLLLAASAIPLLLGTSDGVRAQRRSDDVAACARQLRSSIDIAEAALQRAESARTDLFLAGLTAIATGDDVRLETLARREPAIRAQVSDAQHQLDEVNAGYARATALPAEDFLEECNDDWPNDPALDRDSVGPFTSCAEARAAGRAPIARGEPGYTPALDADGDGVACE